MLLFFSFQEFRSYEDVHVLLELLALGQNRVASRADIGLGDSLNQGIPTRELACDDFERRSSRRPRLPDQVLSQPIAGTGIPRLRRRQSRLHDSPPFFKRHDIEQDAHVVRLRAPVLYGALDESFGLDCHVRSSVHCMAGGDKLPRQALRNVSTTLRHL